MTVRLQRPSSRTVSNARPRSRCEALSRWLLLALTACGGGSGAVTGDGGSPRAATDTGPTRRLPADSGRESDADAAVHGDSRAPTTTRDAAGGEDTGAVVGGKDASTAPLAGEPDAGEKADTGAHDAGHHDADATPSPSSGTTPTLRQYAVEQTNGGSGVYELNSVRQFKMPTVKGNTLWVVATIPNDGGQGNVKVTDTQGNTFTSLNYEEDNSNGHQSVWQFYAKDIKGDGATADTVTVLWAEDNYKGVLIAEVAGVTEAALVGHSGNIQDHNAPAGDDTVTSGPIAVSATETPALLLAVSMDTYGGTSDEGGDGYAGPAYGNAFADETYLWNWDPGQTCNDNLACNLAAFETKTITASGSTAALFTARAPGTGTNSGAYVTVSAIFH